MFCILGHKYEFIESNGAHWAACSRCCQLRELKTQPQKDDYSEKVTATNEMKEAFGEVVTPVIEWLAKNQHPHTMIVIDSIHAELVEGVMVVHTEEFLQD